MVVIAYIAGVLAMLAAMSSFQFKETKKLNIVYLVSMILWVIHFSFLTAFVKPSVSGIVINLIGIIRNICMITLPKGSTAERISKALIISALAFLPVTEFFVSKSNPEILSFGFMDIAVSVSMIIGSLLFWKNNGKLTRIAQLLIISPIWIIYDLMAV